MRVLGIDPGTSVVGFGCIELAERRTARSVPFRILNAVSLGSGGGDARLVDAGVVRLGRRVPIETRLLRLGEALDRLLERLRPSSVAVEEAFYGKSVQAALRIGEARGVVLLCASRAGIRVAQYAPATVKLRVAGAGAASKAALARMVGASLGAGAGGLPADATDALAVALCHCFALPVVGESEETP